MTALTDLAGGGPRVSRETWETACRGLFEGGWALLGLWGDSGVVRMALLDDATGEHAVIALDCPDGTFPSVGRHHAPAIRLERAVRDLDGLMPAGAPDLRPWLDHGRWTGGDKPPGYAFLPAEGAHLHQIPVGPVHAGIIEPGHFRFTAGGETVVRLEERLGYVHKGVERLMEGTDVAHAAQLAGRVSGNSTVAYAYAFARAFESASGTEVPARAIWLRALMAELERIANHFGDIGAICNDAAFALIHAHTGVAREEVLRATNRLFGHRLMMDRIVAGGVAVDPAGAELVALECAIPAWRKRLADVVRVYDNTVSLQDRTVSTGILKSELARRFGAGGYVGRASGRAFDARKRPSYEPYPILTFDVPMREDGDVNARVWIRVREIEESLKLIEQIVAGLPDGPVLAPTRAAGAGEALALTEGFRGDVMVWLRLGTDGRVARCHLRDPSWFQWPLLEAAIEGNIVADFPLCNKSFNCSYSGHDL